MAGDDGGRRIDVRAGAGDYPVLIQRGLLERVPELIERYAPAARYAVIADSRVAPLYAAPLVEACSASGLEVELFVFPEGERNKTRKQWSILTDALLSSGFGRDTTVVAVGGGVTGDLAGFVAATFLRGVPVVQVPTSLVAMIDASVGGKTGVDVRAGKNLVGAFHPPRAVLADPETAATLDREERAQGLAEALKHGAVLDADYFHALTAAAAALLDGEPQAVLDAVARSVALKADVVSKDEQEAGLREILNFGHTYGHALEAAAGFAVGHGTAVARGMILEARLGERLGITRAGTTEELEEGLRRFGLGAFEGGGLPAEKVLGFLGADKKVRGGRARFVLLRRLGEVHADGGWSHVVPLDAVRDVFTQSRSAAEGI